MERAARGGLPRACLKLAAMREQGVGVTTDPIEAAAWYRVAAARAADEGARRDAEVGRDRSEAGLDEGARRAARARAEQLLEALSSGSGS
jgi:hypothetical protein